MRKFLAVSLSALLSLLPACANARLSTSSSPHAHYVQQQVCNPLRPGDRICLLGDSVFGRGFWPGGFALFWDQMNQMYHPESGFTLLNAGYAYLSSTVLNYPGYGDAWFNYYVVNQQPTVVIINIGIDDMLAGNGNFDMAQYGVNLQQIIDRVRAIPSVRDVVLATPMAYGEKRVGQNPHDVGMNNLIAVINQTSVNNGIPVIDLRSMIVDADLYCNGADFPHGVLLGDIPWGIHPICRTDASPPDPINFNSQFCNQLLGNTFYRAFGE